MGKNFYDKIGLESLKFRRWFREFPCFHKVQHIGLTNYLPQLIPTNIHSYILGKPLNIPDYYCRTNTFKNSFFPNVINEWNSLDEKIKGATSFSLLKVSLLNSAGIRLLKCLCLDLSHLNEYKYRTLFCCLCVLWTHYAPAVP